MAAGNESSPRAELRNLTHLGISTNPFRALSSNENPPRPLRILAVVGRACDSVGPAVAHREPIVIYTYFGKPAVPLVKYG